MKVRLIKKPYTSSVLLVGNTYDVISEDRCGVMIQDSAGSKIYLYSDEIELVKEDNNDKEDSKDNEEFVLDYHEYNFIEIDIKTVEKLLDYHFEGSYDGFKFDAENNVFTANKIESLE